MRAGLLLVVLARVAVAQPLDAPVDMPSVPDVGGTLTAQELCLTPTETMTLARRLEADRATIVALKAAPQGVPLAAVIVGAVVAAVAVGAAAWGGYEAGKATQPKQ